MHERKEVCSCDEKVQPQTSLCLFIRTFSERRNQYCVYLFSRNDAVFSK